MPKRKSKQETLFLRPGLERMDLLFDEKKKILNETGEDLTLQEVVYRLIDQLKCNQEDQQNE